MSKKGREEFGKIIKGFNDIYSWKYEFNGKNLTKHSKEICVLERWVYG